MMKYSEKRPIIPNQKEDEKDEMCVLHATEKGTLQRLFYI